MNNSNSQIISVDSFEKNTSNSPPSESLTMPNEAFSFPATPITILRSVALAYSNEHKPILLLSKEMEVLIDASLDYDFEKSLLALYNLRNLTGNNFLQQAAVVRAANHAKANKSFRFADLGLKIVKNKHDIDLQVAYQMKAYGRNIPTVLKRLWLKSTLQINEKEANLIEEEVNKKCQQLSLEVKLLSIEIEIMNESKWNAISSRIANRKLFEKDVCKVISNANRPLTNKEIAHALIRKTSRKAPAR